MENKNTITNDELYAEIEAGIDRIKNHIVDELLMSDDERLLDDILDDIQEAIARAKIQKQIYRSWIYEHTIPDEFIFDPEEEDVIEDEE